MWELVVETRVRQSPDWRFAGRHSGEWRSRDRRLAEVSLNSQVEPILNALSRGFRGDSPVPLPNFGFQAYLFLLSRR